MSRSILVETMDSYDSYLYITSAHIKMSKLGTWPQMVLSAFQSLSFDFLFACFLLFQLFLPPLSNFPVSS